MAPVVTTASPDPPAEDNPGDGPVQMSGTAHDASMFVQVAGDQYNIYLPPKSPAPARCTLPADTVAFTGRTRELHGIITAVTTAAQAGRVVAIHAIDGMPGVGKTALAVHVGHLVTEKFPDRQLFVDLHAHTPGREPVDPADALADLLTADGVDPRYLPEGLDGRATLWRDRMARKQMLLVLDNAASSGQVTSLLPGSARCAVLVTSRRFLGDLPAAVPVPLDVLTAEDAQQMFLRLAPRAATEPARVTELVGLCGHLPLAISLLASVFCQHRSWALDQLIEETRATLLSMTAENRTVAAAFDLSYQHLPPDRQRFFRHLGLHPGIDIDPYAAAALTSVSLDQAGKHLDALYRDHLLDEPLYRRYRMHDLIRDYARALAGIDPASERDQALDGLLDYYQHTATLADTHLTWRACPSVPALAVPPAAVPGLASRDQALAWLRAERANLLACLQYATGHAQHARVIGFTAGVASLLRSDGPWTQAVDLHTQAIAATQHLGDRLGESNARIELGVARHLIDDYPGSAQVLEQALDLSRKLGNRNGEANALTNLGLVRRVTGDFAGATQLLEQALDLYRDLGNRNGEANALTHLGTARWVAGDFAGATQLLEQALDLYRDLGNRVGEAAALIILGGVRRVTGDLAGATQVLEQALSLSRDLNNRVSEVNSLTYLGAVRWVTGDYPGAAHLLEQALDLSRDLGDRLGEAAALIILGGVRRVTGDLAGATQVLEQALDLYRDLGSRLGEANALTNLGAVRRMTGDYPGAAHLLEQALDLYRDLGDQDGEAEVLNQSGMLWWTTGETERAVGCHRRALHLARAVGSPLEQARALEGTGRCALAAGDTTVAVTELRQALEIYRRIGAVEATQLVAELAGLDTK